MTSTTMTILHTNDMHGRVEAMVRLSSLARRLRQIATSQGRPAFFWDAGDALDRLYRTCSLSKGAALARVLNAMGYDLMTMGNDILLTYGPEAMTEVARRLDFPVLAANCRDGEGPLSPGLQESALCQLPQGPVLGVFGLTAPWGGLYEAFGYRFPDTVEGAVRLVTKLRGEGAQVVIALSHLGLADDKLMAEQVSGLDVIIGGHSHDLLEHGLEHNGVLIAQAGRYAEALGIVELSIDSDTGRVLHRSAQVMPIPLQESPDPVVAQAAEEAEREVDALAAQPVGQVLRDLDLDHRAECGIGNLAADALRARMGAEAAVIFSGQLRSGLTAGTITFGQIDEASLLTANPQRTVVRGAQILDALERGIDPSSVDATPHGFRGTPLGWPQVSGMRIEYDSNRPAGQRIHRVEIGGEALSTSRTYLLAHTDAETSPTLGILRLEAGQESEAEVPTVTREVLHDYIQQHSPVGIPPAGRWIDVGRSTC